VITAPGEPGADKTHDVLVLGGGNSRHTRNLRCMHDRPSDVLTDVYSEEEYWQDFLTGVGFAALVRHSLERSRPAPTFLSDQALPIEPPLRAGGARK
jgi:tricarballylate dehydrogenase